MLCSKDNSGNNLSCPFSILEIKSETSTLLKTDSLLILLSTSIFFIIPVLSEVFFCDSKFLVQALNSGSLTLVG